MRLDGTYNCLFEYPSITDVRFIIFYSCGRFLFCWLSKLLKWWTRQLFSLFCMSERWWRLLKTRLVQLLRNGVLDSTAIWWCMLNEIYLWICFYKWCVWFVNHLRMLSLYLFLWLITIIDSIRYFISRITGITTTEIWIN